MKRTELIRTMDGIGQVTSKDKHACDVCYSLKVCQEVVIMQGERRPGHTEIRSGTMTVVRGDDGPLFDGEDLVLHLDDGQKVPIIADPHVNITSRPSEVWSIVGKGVFFTD